MKSGIHEGLLVPLCDLKRIDRLLLNELQQTVVDVMNTGWFLQGQYQKLFESQFADYIGARHCLCVGNGTDAIEIALRAIGCEAGDRVITVANAGCYTTVAARAIGAVPVYVDVDSSLNMCLEDLDATLRGSGPIRCVVLTHLYGQMANARAAREICERHGVEMIEDCAQAHGASFLGEKAGSIGSISTFSFYPTKNLGAMGDAGALLTSDDELAERINQLRQYGWEEKYWIRQEGGRNSRIDEIQAAILGTKLRYLDQWNEKRRKIHQRYANAIKSDRLRLAHEGGSESYVGHLCIAMHQDRVYARKVLEDHGIATSIHYPVLDYKQPAYSTEYSNQRPLVQAELWNEHIFTIPCFPEMTEEEIHRVCDALGAID